MQRTLVRGIAALGCAVIVSGATAAAVELTGDEATGPAVTQAGAPSADVLVYWSQTKDALSPLLLHVRALPEMITALQDTPRRATPGQLRQATGMADNFATARDLVGRLGVPRSVTGDVSELLQLACQLYRQSALSIAELRGSERGIVTQSVLRRAGVLHAMGDRLIDQARRVLNIDGAASAGAPVELQYAPPVPAVAEVTGSPVPTGPSPATLDETLRAAGGSLAYLTARPADAVSSGLSAGLPTLAAALERSPENQSEDVLGARLAILLALVGEQAQADGHRRSAEALRMLSNDLWNTARTLAPRPHAALETCPAPLTPRSVVWTGGAFNGKPPALKPGDDVGAGLPGGLPGIDIAQILRG